MGAATGLAFSAEEYGRRLQLVRRHMAEHGVDVLVVDDPESLAYLTGYCPRATRYQACLLPLEDEPAMVVRTLDETTFVEQSWVKDHVVFRDWDDSIATLVHLVRERGWADRRLGLELDSHALTVERYQAIVTGLPGATVVDFSAVVREIRLRKSPEELAYLRRAGEIADACMRAAIETIQAGRTERDVATAVYATSLAMGGDNIRTTLMSSGRRVQVVHGGLGDHQLETGDLVFIEQTPQVAGYSSRIIRTVAVGQPTDEQCETARLLIDIQDEQFAAMRPGVLAREVDRIAREGVVRAGLRDSYDVITGYTLGLVGPHKPTDFTRVFVPTADWHLEEGMVFHMYVLARGMGFSETVLVTADGHERLTHLERGLVAR